MYSMNCFTYWKFPKFTRTQTDISKCLSLFHKQSKVLSFQWWNVTKYIPVFPFLFLWTSSSLYFTGNYSTFYSKTFIWQFLLIVNLQILIINTKHNYLLIISGILFWTKPSGNELHQLQHQWCSVIKNYNPVI